MPTEQRQGLKNTRIISTEYFFFKKCNGLLEACVLESRGDYDAFSQKGEREKKKKRKRLLSFAFSSAIKFRYLDSYRKLPKSSLGIPCPHQWHALSGSPVARTVINKGHVRKGWFPLPRNFYVRTWVKFTFANKIEAMYERSDVSVKVEPCSTSLLTSTLYTLPLFYLRD